MAGDNQQPVKGDVRRFVGGGYKPVGATTVQVLTQGPDWDGINRGIGMFLDLGSNYARQGGGSGKQDYSGQYQVEMNDIAANPEYHDAGGMYNSKGREAIRALNQKYAPYVSGAEIRSTESYVGGGYKESVDNAIREVNIKQRAADYEAQNTRFVTMYDEAHPENINLPFATRARLGKQLSDETNEFVNLSNALIGNNLQSISDPAVRRMAEIIESRMNEEQLNRFINTGDTVQDQQNLTDTLASLAVQQGHSQAEARVMATNAAQGVFAHLNKYKKDMQQLTEDELKFMKSHDADEAYRNLSSEDKAFYALTGQFSPNTMIKGLTGQMSVSDAFKTEKVGDGYKRTLISTNKDVMNFGLNYGDDLTASATLTNAVPMIEQELNKGNSAPLRQLRRLPALANIVQSGNKSEVWAVAKQKIADMLSTELVRNSKTYYKGNNVINDEMDYQNRATVELAQYLGFSNEETKNIVNKALETMGLKHINGVYTADELAGAMSASNIMPWAMEGIESKPASKDIGEYLDDSNRMSLPQKEQQNANVVNDEANQMSKINVYETPEYQEFRSKIAKAVKNKQMTREQAENEDNQFLTKAKEALARVASEFGVKSAKADTIPYKEGSKTKYTETYSPESGYTAQDVNPNTPVEDLYLEEYIDLYDDDEDITYKNYNEKKEQHQRMMQILELVGELPVKKQKKFFDKLDKRIKELQKDSPWNTNFDGQSSTLLNK